MAKKLDNVIEVFVNENYKNKFKASVKQEEKEQILSLAKEKTRNELLDEIREELTPDIKKEVIRSYEDKNRKKQISNMKKLLTEGFFLAIFVGLFVNQATEIIDFYKGENVTIGKTVIISAILFGICLIIVGFFFIKEFLRIYNNYMKGSSNNENY